MTRLFVSALVALLASACATPPSQDQINNLLSGALRAANLRADEGSTGEAAMLARAVQRVDPNYPGVRELSERLGPQIDEVENRGVLGINRRARVREDSSFLYRLILYVPDRAFDLLDLFTFEVHLGFGAYANVHATRAVQAGGGLRTKIGAGLHDQRSIGLANEAEVGLAALALGAQSFGGSSVGLPGGVALGADSMAGMHWPSDELYQTYRDYWAIGASLTLGLVGVEFDFHPVQIFDFLGGVLFMDPARDDLATTRRMRFNSLEIEAIRTLGDIERRRVWRGAPHPEEDASPAPDEPEAAADEAPEPTPGDTPAETPDAPE